jgi:glycogen debranching enzyme
MDTAGLGQVSEVLDGDAPHRPGGCCAQAWSVAELLRAAIEDVAAVPRTALLRGARNTASATG